MIDPLFITAGETRPLLYFHFANNTSRKMCDLRLLFPSIITERVSNMKRHSGGLPVFTPMGVVISMRSHGNGAETRS